jgi:hypothetical protein
MSLKMDKEDGSKFNLIKMLIDSKNYTKYIIPDSNTISFEKIRPLEEYVEIGLLCSNKDNRIAQLSKLLLTTIKDMIHSHGKSLLLWVANPTINQSAMDFYVSIGFKSVEKTSLFLHNNPNVSGGKRNKKITRPKRKVQHK